MSTAQLSFRDTVLPSQPILQREFEGDEGSFYTALHEAVVTFSGLKFPTEEFHLQQSPQVSIEAMASSPMILRFLQLLILLKQPKRVLELGTFLGISTMQMARVLPEGGRIVTMEKYDHFADLARQNFLTNGLAHKIQLIQGDAFAELQKLDRAERFDMIFLDGNKERYDEYFPLLDAHLVPQGLLVVDDVLYHGDVLNERPKSEKGIGVRKLLERVKARADYQKAMLPVGNGLLLMVKVGSDRSA